MNAPQAILTKFESAPTGFIQYYYFSPAVSFSNFIRFSMEKFNQRVVKNSRSYS